MENKIISENQVKDILDKLISEEVSKVRREEYNRVQFKMDELQNSLIDTVRELRKLEESIPTGLKTVTNGRMNSISVSLTNAQRLLIQLKEKVRQHKKSSFTQIVDEKKK
jgi:hypothetical protein